MEKKAGTKKTTNEKPISLYPFKVEDALKKIMQVLPPKKKKSK